MGKVKNSGLTVNGQTTEELLNKQKVSYGKISSSHLWQNER
jgi:hypothetical protein